MRWPNDVNFPASIAPRSPNNCSAFSKRFRIGRLEPAKRRDVFNSARFQSQDDFCQIEPFHFRKFLCGALEMFALRPKSQAMSRGGAPRAAGPLVGRGAADLLDEKGVDAAPGIEARDPRQPAVDHHPHAIDREGRFRHVGRHDHFALFVLRPARRPVPPAAVRHRAAMRRTDRSRARRG